MTLEATLTSATVPDHMRVQHPLQLTRWVNEPLPDLRAILCSHDVARLTRRPTWLLCGLAWLGQFPRRRRYQGRSLGWHRDDVLEWLSRGVTPEPERPPPLPRCCRRRHPQQRCLPLECSVPCAPPPRPLPPDSTAATVPPAALERASRSSPRPRRRVAPPAAVA